MTWLLIGTILEYIPIRNWTMEAEGSKTVANMKA